MEGFNEVSTIRLLKQTVDGDSLRQPGEVCHREIRKKWLPKKQLVPVRSHSLFQKVKNFPEELKKRTADQGEVP